LVWNTKNVELTQNQTLGGKNEKGIAHIVNGVIYFFWMYRRKILLPTMPKVETKAGRDCMRNCQGQHNDCINSCKRKVLGPTFDPECVDNCHQKLGECYQLCVEEDK